MSNTPKSKNYVIYDAVNGKILAIFGSPYEPFIDDGQSFIVDDCENIKTHKVNLHTRKVESIL